MNAVLETPETREFVERDRLKAAIYARAGVREYWIVDGDGKRIERCGDVDVQTATFGKREIFAGGETLCSTVLPSLQIVPAKLFEAPGA